MLANAQGYEYHLTILSVKMQIKFPCRMKLQHQGSLITGEAQPSPDHRYVFNQEALLRDIPGKDYFDITVHIVTDKGANYIAGVAKIYQSELLRSQGERLVLSLTKCMDPQAFCEVRVDQISNTRPRSRSPKGRSNINIESAYRGKEITEYDEPVIARHPSKQLESKSQYQYPLRPQTNWDAKSRVPPPAHSVYQPSRVPKSRPNQQVEALYYGLGDSAVIQRQKLMQAQVYKQGYNKLKQKYRKQAQINKQEINKRLALQNQENNLKLEIVRYKMRLDQADRIGAERNNKIKEMQAQLVLMQQKEAENRGLRDDISKKDGVMRGLEEQIRVLNNRIDQIRDQTDIELNSQNADLKDLQAELENYRIKLEGKASQLQRQNKNHSDLVHQRDLQTLSLKENLQRQRKALNELQKQSQAKAAQMQKTMQSQRSQAKAHLQDSKQRADKLERQLQRLQEQKKQLTRLNDQNKNNLLKTQYEKRMLGQELESIRGQYDELKKYKEKCADLLRENRELLQGRTLAQKQMEKAMQNKQVSLSDMGRQFQEQLEYYRRLNRELDDKLKHATNKLVETQGQLEVTRGQLDKSRRNHQGAVRQAAQALEKEKTARRAMRARQQEILSMQSQYATMKQKVKSLQQICKLQVDKVRQQMEKISLQYQNEQQRKEQLGQMNSQLTLQLSRLKIKLQYAQERGQKDGQNIRQKQQQIDQLMKGYQEQVAILEQAVNQLRVSEKELSTKNQKNQFDLIRGQERAEKSRREIKALEDRSIRAQSSLQTRNVQYDNLNKQKQDLLKRIVQFQSLLGQSKKQSMGLQSECNRLQKVQQMIKGELGIAKNDLSNKASTITQKERLEEQLRKQIKNLYDAQTELQNRFSGYRKETDKHREVVFDTIYRYLVPLLSSNSSVVALPPKAAQSTFTQAVNTITLQCKDLKQTLIRQTDQIKQYQREKERMQQEFSVTNNKSHNKEVVFQKQIEDLEGELSALMEEKQAQANAFTDIIADLNDRLRFLQGLQEQLNSQIQQLNFSLNTLRMEADAVGSDNAKKISNLKKLNKQLQDKIEEKNQIIIDLQQRCGGLEGDIDHLNLTVENMNESLLKKERTNKQLEQVRYNNQLLVEQLKKFKKELLEKVADLQLHLNTEREISGKTKQLLEEEERKSAELKVFISGLMKQKESAIKGDLEKSQSIMQLQNRLIQINKELQIVKTDNQKYLLTLQGQRQSLKKSTMAVRQLQIERAQLTQKNKKLQQRLREKEREMVEWEESSKRLEQKYDRTVQKHRVELSDLQYEIELINNSSIQLTRDSNDKIIALENQLHDKRASLNALTNSYALIQEELYGQREKVISFEAQLNSSNVQVGELRRILKEKQTILQQYLQQNGHREEKMFQTAGRIFNLEKKLQATQREGQERVEVLNSDWTDKYESVVQEYEQRLELTQKERDYLIKQVQVKDEDIAKLNQQIRNTQASQRNHQQAFQDKIKQLEQDKMALNATKNNQLQRLSEQAKAQGDAFKGRQSELRRVSHELQVARKTIVALEQKVRDYDEKVKGAGRAYQTQMEQLKKKQLANRSYREEVSNHFWTVEREIKKSVQHFIQNFIQMVEDKNSQKILDLVRTHEKSVLTILTSRPMDK